MKRLIFVLLVVLALMAPAIMNAQTQALTMADSAYLESFLGKSFDQQVAKAWVDICALNRENFPDSNMVQPGNIIMLPLHHIYFAMMAPQGASHMWMASVMFVHETVQPYIDKKMQHILLTSPDTNKTGSSAIRLYNSFNDDWFWIPMAVILLLAIVVLVTLVKSTLKREHERKAFINNPPPLDAPDSQVCPLAERALRRAYGRDFQIIGDIERGVATGRQIMFNKDGSTENVNFYDEPAFRARIRFSNGAESLAVCKWACFNPCVNLVSSKYKGTFTPNGGQPEVIENISVKEMRNIRENICHAALSEESASRLSSSSVPAAKPESPVATAKSDGKIRLTKLQISKDKGINIEGDFTLSIREVNGLVKQVMTK